LESTIFGVDEINKGTLDCDYFSSADMLSDSICTIGEQPVGAVAALIQPQNFLFWPEFTERSLNHMTRTLDFGKLPNMLCNAMSLDARELVIQTPPELCHAEFGQTPTFCLLFSQ
jgi:hypothetical protein